MSFSFLLQPMPTSFSSIFTEHLSKRTSCNKRVGGIRQHSGKFSDRNVDKDGEDGYIESFFQELEHIFLKKRLTFKLRFLFES